MCVWSGGRAGLTAYLFMRTTVSQPSSVTGCEPETRHEKEISVTTDRNRRRSGVQGTAVEKAQLLFYLEGGAGEDIGCMMARN